MVGMAMGMGAGLRSAAEAASLAEDYVSPPKYKSSLLHRYLNDSLRHVMVANAVMDARKRNHSGSFSSNEYDDELLSPSSSEAEANFVYRAGKEPHFLHSFPSRVSLTHTTSFTFVLFLSPSICTFCFNSCSWSIISNCLLAACLPACLDITLLLPSHTVLSHLTTFIWRLYGWMLFLCMLKWRCSQEGPEP